MWRPFDWTRKLKKNAERNKQQDAILKEQAEMEKRSRPLSMNQRADEMQDEEEDEDFELNPAPPPGSYRR